MTALSMLTTEHGIAEYHAIITGTPAALGFKEQLSNLLQAYADLRHKLGDRVKPVFKRYFLSDSANQAKFIPRDEECACSIVEQSPLNGTKIAMWVYLQQDVKTQSKGNGVYAVSHGAYTHFWQGGAATPRHPVGDRHTCASARLLAADGGRRMYACAELYAHMVFRP